jgi:MYXO-CTERM domain-containing protein
VPVAKERLVLGPVRSVDNLVAAAVAQAAVTQAIDHSPAVTPPVIEGPTLDARVLVITSDGQDTALGAITSVLSRMGTPYDLVNATTGPPLTAAKLFDGTHGHYNAIILDRGTLLPTSATVLTSGSLFTNDEWNILATYEAQFGVRRAAFYAVPDAEYGFGPQVGVDANTVAVPATCTPAGAAIFPYANCSSISIVGAYVYEAMALDSQTVPLIVDAAGHALAATRTYPNGREALVMTFTQSDALMHTQQLAHGIIHWATRGVHLGERHAYFGPQIDDLFLASDVYGGGTFRITDTDFQHFYDKQTAARTTPALGAVRYDYAVNGQGATSTDPLTIKIMALKGDFGWINHTYDHAELDAATSAQMTSELSQNDIIISTLALQPYSKLNLVTPSITGLNNAQAMTAAAAFGVSYLVSDSSAAGYNNVPYNEGQWNPSAPSILMIPRHPTNLFYDVSTPDEWLAEYNTLYFSYWGRNLTYQELLNEESSTLLLYLLHWEANPWMFHQSNCRDYDAAGHSLLSDLMDMTFSKYNALVKLPLASPTMDDLGKRVAARTHYDTAGVSASITGGVMTVKATAAATVAITGACAAGAENYAGDLISYVDVPAGGSKDVPLFCGVPTPDAGPPGDAGRDGGGQEADGGTQDAQRQDDARPADAAVPNPPVAGCACSVTDLAGARGVPLGFGVILLLALLLGRRRGPGSRGPHNH